MGSQTKSKIPVIDLSKQDLKSGTSTWISTCKDIRHAFEEFGCFEAIYQKFSQELRSEVLASTEELFDVPIEIKVKNTSTKPYFEYYGQYTIIPLYESLAIDYPDTRNATQSFTNLMWPAGNDCFCESSLSMSELVVELDKMITRMLFESYGVEGYYDSYIGSVNYLLRYFKYRAPEPNETKMGLTPHTDKTMTSIIHQINHINGLQVQAKDGEWIDVEPSPSSFIVMAGDALKAWGNDRIRPCRHQVIMDNASQTRYSLGLFSFSSGVVDIPKELGDETQPLKYKPFDHFGFLHFNQSEEGKKSASSIKAYCGI
ncbi:hypothetical protein AB3S75_003567 [Citrus x aurantiifolia]